MLQLLTFLGTSDYKPTCYTWQGKQVTNPTPYAAEALCELYEFVNPDEKIHEVLVFLTPEAREKNWDGFRKNLINKKLNVKDIPIPSGRSEPELWQIFDAVVNAVNPGTQVLFDITNAFRSIPLLVFLASAFLQKARNVTIKGLYYGAFDADPQKPPIFDLTPAIKLLDWLTATEHFITTGSAVSLGSLLSTIQKDFSSKEYLESTPPKRLQELGNSIQSISHSLELIRSRGVLKETANFQKIPAEELNQEIGNFAKPFELLSERIQQSYSQFALLEPENLSNHKLALQKHFLLLRWYVKNEQGAQAILLAREWLVSAECIAQEKNYLDGEKREEVEKRLNYMCNHKRNLNKATARSRDDKITLLWSKLRSYRNDIAHTEMRSGSTSGEELHQYVKTQLIPSLEQVFPEYVNLKLS